MAETRTAQLVLQLKDELTNPLGKVSKAMQGVLRAEDALTGQSDKLFQATKKLAEFGKVESRLQKTTAAYMANQVKLKDLTATLLATDKPTKALQDAFLRTETVLKKLEATLGKEKAAVQGLDKAFRELSGSPLNSLAEGEARLRTRIDETTNALRRQLQESARLREEEGRLARRRQAMKDLGGAAGLYLTSHAGQAAEAVLHTYRDFDKERRYGKVVMGLNDEQQKPLVDQAIRGGATTRFNDVQWLESQRELASRGYNLNQVMAFAPVAAKIGQAFDKSMPEGVRALEGAMLGFRKDVSTFDAAVANAGRTADLQVKGSKISGMSYEDIVALYKFGAAPAQMAHLSEEQMLAFGGIAKKSNMGGDESGTAFRALIKNLLSPTSEARTAMAAAGINFGDFQKTGSMNLQGFVSEVARKYGVRLDAATQAGLGDIFADGDLLADPSKFNPAVTELLRGKLGGNDAKSLKSIAGLATRYRDASVEGIDTNGLMTAVMQAISKSPALANAIFGSKQGGRIYATLGDPKLYAHFMDELLNHSQGFAQNVSDERMAGFDGAMSKLEGSIKNLETAIGRAVDNDGKGGLLTGATETAAHFVQTLAEADPKLILLGTTAAAAATAFAAFKSVEWLKDFLGSGTRLNLAAAAQTEAGVQLKAAAQMQMAAAERLDVLAAKNGLASSGAAVGGAAGTTAAVAGAEGSAWTLGGLFSRALPVVGWTYAAIEAGKYWKDVEEQTKATRDTAAAKALPDMDKQTWGQWLRGATPEPEQAVGGPPAPISRPHTETPPDMLRRMLEKQVEDENKGKSIWHRLFGANTTPSGVVPVAFTQDSASSQSLSAAVARGTYDGFMRVLQGRLGDGGGFGGGDGGSGVIKASWGGDGFAGAGGGGGGGSAGGGSGAANGGSDSSGSRQVLKGSNFRYGRPHTPIYAPGGGTSAGGERVPRLGAKGEPIPTVAGEYDKLPAYDMRAKHNQAAMDRYESYGMNFFKAKGYTPEQAAKIMGSLQHESRFDVKAMNKNDAGPGQDSEGIAQWNRKRRADMHAYVSSMFGGRAYGALTDQQKYQGQLSFVDRELHTTHRTALNALLHPESNKTPYDFNRAFEGYDTSIPGNDQIRLKNTARLLSNDKAGKYTGGGGTFRPLDVGGLGGDVMERLQKMRSAGIISNEQCVALAKAAVGMQGVPVTDWRKGDRADAGTLKPGTPIATFLNRKGRESDRYAGGGTGTPGAHLDHAGVFQSYIRDKDGKPIGMNIAEQYARSHGIHSKAYYFGQGWGEGDGSNYWAVKGSDGTYLGGKNNPMSAGPGVDLRKGGPSAPGGLSDKARVALDAIRKHEPVSHYPDEATRARARLDALPRKSKPEVSPAPANPIEAGLHPAVDHKHLHTTLALLDDIHHRMGAINDFSAGSRGAHPKFTSRRSFVSDGTRLT